MAKEGVDLKIVNSEKMLALFKELDIKQQKKVIRQGMSTAGKVILVQAKANFNAVKKGKSLTGYKDVNSSFKVEVTKGFGVKVGVKYIDKTGKTNVHKYRWIEWGTDERFRNLNKKRFLGGSKTLVGKGGSTGKITATHFFEDAITAKSAEAQNRISSAISESLERALNNVK